MSKCKQEIEVVAGMLQDFISTLPPSTRAAVSSQANTCLTNISEALTPVPPAASVKAPKQPKPKRVDPLVPAAE